MTSPLGPFTYDAAIVHLRSLHPAHLVKSAAAPEPKRWQVQPVEDLPGRHPVASDGLLRSRVRLPDGRVGEVQGVRAAPFGRNADLVVSGRRVRVAADQLVVIADEVA